MIGRVRSGNDWSLAIRQSSYGAGPDLDAGGADEAIRFKEAGQTTKPAVSPCGRLHMCA
jgi:hypothetical protein